MSDLIKATPGFLVGSFLYRKDQITQNELKKLWEDKLGESIYFYHPFYPMKCYYAKEMGDESLLSRFYVVATTFQQREALVDYKIWADDYEKSSLVDKARIVNLDIGLLTLENLSLATGKSYAHRTYLTKGVYSDLTLMFQAKSFATLAWTYPDYSHPEVIDFFNYTRKILHLKLLKN